MTDIRGVVLLEADPETVAELVRNAPAAGFDAPVGLADAFGAQEDGHPQVGRIVNLRAIGNHLIGDLADVPRALASALRAGAGRVRTSIYEDFTRGRQHLGRVLKHVMILDSGLAPQSLSDMAALFTRTGNEGAGRVVKFTMCTTFDREVTRMVVDLILSELHAQLKDALAQKDHQGAEVIRKKIEDREAVLGRQTIVSHSGLVGIEAGRELTYRAHARAAEDHVDLTEGARRSLDEDAVLKAAVTGMPVVVTSTPQNPSGDFAQAVRKFRQRNPKATHDEAVRVVRRERPDLADGYARS